VPVFPGEVLHGCLRTELRQNLIPEEVPVFPLPPLVCRGPVREKRLTCLFQGRRGRLLNQECLLFSLSLPGVFAVLSAPCPDCGPFLFCLSQRPLPSSLPIRTYSDLNPLPSVVGTTGREPSDADKGLSTP
jgi:hypothetical protein